GAAMGLEIDDDEAGPGGLVIAQYGGEPGFARFRGFEMPNGGRALGGQHARQQMRRMMIVIDQRDKGRVGKVRLQGAPQSPRRAGTPGKTNPSRHDSAGQERSISV